MIETFEKHLPLSAGLKVKEANIDMNLGNMIVKALQYHQSGQLRQAEEIYRSILEANPDHSDSLHLLGVLAHKSGKYDTAINMINRAIQIDPGQPVFYCNLGNVLKDRGKMDEAISCYQKALDLNPALIEASYNLGNTLYERGELDQAISYYQETLRLKPDLTEAHNNLGIAFHKKGKFDEAIACFENTLQQKPNFPDAYKNLGDVFKDQEKPDQAIQQYEKALALKPDYVEAYVNMGNVLHTRGKLNEAVRCYQNALQIYPEYVDAYANLGKTLKDQGRLDEAVSCYDKGILIEPDHAELLFDRSTVLLLRGDFIEGWEGYERRFDRPGWKATYPHRFEIPRWDGAPFAGKTLFIHCEQGFGDILQFVRYLPMVKARGGKVVFETPKPLAGLLRDFPGVDALVEGPSNSKQAIGCDFYMPLMSLPGLFGTLPKTIPARTPYIYADSQKVGYWSKRFSGEDFKVGIVWGGKATDPNRSCELKSFAPLAAIPGVRLYGLQKGKAADQVEELPDGMVVTNLGGEFEDFTDTAGVIENLDLLISIDTSVAHLAGALGKPVWVLLTFSPDWRWLLDREDSPWYPTMRLFRQQKRGGWDKVLHLVAHELADLVQNQ